MRVSSDVDVSHLGLINQSRLKSGEPFPKCQFNVNVCVCVYVCFNTRGEQVVCFPSSLTDLEWYNLGEIRPQSASVYSNGRSTELSANCRRRDRTRVHPPPHAIWRGRENITCTAMPRRSAGD